MLWRSQPAHVDKGAEQSSVVNPIEDHQKKMKLVISSQFLDMVVPSIGDA